MLPKSVLLKICTLFRSLAVTAGTLISATVTAQLWSYQTFSPNQSNPELQEALQHVAKYAEYLKCGMIIKVRAAVRPLGIAVSWSSFLQGEDAGSSRLTQNQHLPVILCGQPQLLLPMTQFQQLTDGTRSTPFWRKQSLASLFWFSPSHGSFFQAPYKALEPIYYIKSHKWHLKRGKSQGLPELYYHFYCYWLFNIFYIGSIKQKC